MCWRTISWLSGPPASEKPPMDKMERLARTQLKSGTISEDWGKVVAHRAFGDEGPDLDLNFDAIEAVAFQAAQAVIKGTIQQSLSQQMRKLGETQSCPQCRRVCPVETEPRELIVRGATVQYDEPKCHCPTCRRDFFPSPSRVAT